MYILRSITLNLPVTLREVVGRTVHLGFDTDNLIACFSTRAEAICAQNESESKNFKYHHSLSMANNELIIVELH